MSKLTTENISILAEHLTHYEEDEKDKAKKVVKQIVDSVLDKKELLYILIEKCDTLEHGPTKIEFKEPPINPVIGIGDDHVADITISEQALEKLEDQVDFNIE